MICFWGHKWPRWSDPIHEPAVIGGVQYAGVPIQRRVCERCGLVVLRQVDLA